MRPGGAARRFAPQASSVKEARDFVAERAPLDEGQRDIARLCASELATNALVHGGGSFSVSVRWPLDGADDGVLRVEVADRSRTPPMEREGSDGGGGWGIHIVAALASSWGYELSDEGKVVWFEIERRSRTEAS